MFRATDFKRTLFFLFSDILISYFTLFIAYNLRFNFHVTPKYYETFVYVFLTIVVFKLFFMAYFHIYSVAWRFFSLKDAKKIFYAHLLGYTLFTIIYYVYPQLFNPFPRSVIIIDMFLSFILIGSLRILKRIIIEENSDINLKKTMIVSATEYAQTLIKQKNDFYIDAIVDDSPSVIGTYISNIKVSSFEEIENIAINQNIESAIITKDLDKNLLQEIYTKLHNAGIRDIFIATLSQDNARLKNLSVEDLLARRPADLDKAKISSFLQDKTILITGAGGSIGSEIVRQCIKYQAHKLILVDHSEFNLYEIDQEVNASNIVLVMQSVTNRTDLEKTFKHYKPDIVIHAAAYKHVPLVEANIAEAITNNVLGTKNVIDCAIESGVAKVVLISTDKAVRPTNVMGTTKRICELYAQNSNGQGTDIVAVRFGNVLGSSGSVIPKFKKQIEEGRNITVTHPDITRYFMLIPEACELVLQAGAIGSGGEIFILDMGAPVKIVDLAQKMIDLSGKSEIEIEFCGLRAGEKLYEELLIDDSDCSTEYDSITVAKPTPYEIKQLTKDIEELLSCEDKLKKLKEIVPEFHHQLN